MDSSTATNLQSRDAVLEKLSRTHLADALQAPSANAGATGAAFQAGYFALMSSLSADEVGAFMDHPNVEAAVLGAHRLQLTTDDLAIAREGAVNYYSPEAQSDHDVRRQVEWARRVRAAAGWPE